MDPHFGQGRKVGADQCLEPLRVLLVRAVSPQELISEIDHDLTHQGAAFRVLRIPFARNFDGRQQVFFAVRPHHTDGQLAAREHDRLPKIGQHETQRTGRVGHGVCAVQHHKPIVTIPSR